MANCLEVKKMTYLESTLKNRRSLIHQGCDSAC
jgi:hypothetical protein